MPQLRGTWGVASSPPRHPASAQTPETPRVQRQGLQGLELATPERCGEGDAAVGKEDEWDVESECKGTGARVYVNGGGGGEVHMASRLGRGSSGPAVGSRAQAGEGTGKGPDPGSEVGAGDAEMSHGARRGTHTNTHHVRSPPASPSKRSGAGRYGVGAGGGDEKAEEGAHGGGGGLPLGKLTSLEDKLKKRPSMEVLFQQNILKINSIAVTPHIHATQQRYYFSSPLSGYIKYRKFTRALTSQNFCKAAYAADGQLAGKEAAVAPAHEAVGHAQHYPGGRRVQGTRKPPVGTHSGRGNRFHLVLCQALHCTLLVCEAAAAAAAAASGARKGPSQTGWGRRRGSG
jgi:hypothetical protein